MSTLDKIRLARQNKNPAILTDHIPYAKALGITLSIEDDELIGRMEFDQPLIGDLGVGALHGGTIATLLESTAILTLLWQIDDMNIPKTINSTVEFLQPGRPLPTYATAQITRHGRRVANVRCTAWQKDRAAPIAASYSHFLLVSS